MKMMAKACFLFLVCVLAVAEASESATVGCENIWPGASAQNSVQLCLSNQERIRSHWFYYIPAAFAALLVILAVLIFPLVFALRQLCHLCGSNRPRPDECCVWNSQYDNMPDETLKKFYPPERHLLIKISAYVIVFVAFGCLIVMVNGTGLIAASSREVFKDLNNALVKTRSIFDNIDAAVRVEGGIDGFDYDSLMPILHWWSTANREVNRYSDTVKNNRAQIQVGMNLLSSVPMILLLLLPFYSVFNDCRSFFPACTTVFYFLASLVFGLLAVLFFMLGYGIEILGGETDAYRAQRPGIGMWYLEPLCDANVAPGFRPLVTYLTDTEAALATKTCDLLEAYCKDGAYDANTPHKVFRCKVDPASTKTCEEEPDQRFSAICCDTNGLPNAPNPFSSGCVAPTCNEYTTQEVSVSSGETFFFSNCEWDCQASAQLHDDMLQAEEYAKQYSSTSYGLWQTRAKLKCTYIVNLYVTSAGKELDALRRGLNMLGAGALIGQVMLIIGICLLFKGQKVFFKPAKDAGVAGVAASKEPVE